MLQQGTDFSISVQHDAWLLITVIKSDKSGVVRLDRRVNDHITVIFPAQPGDSLMILDVQQVVQSKNPRYNMLAEDIGSCTYSAAGLKLQQPCIQLYISMLTQ